MDHSIYDADYYLNGQASGKSLYVNYRWLPDLTLPMVLNITHRLGIERTDTVLDFGCALGFSVLAYRQMGFEAYGIDASEWAIENCDPAVKNYVAVQTRVTEDYEWIVAKDVLEHIPWPDLPITIDNLLNHARKGVFVVVPLSPTPNAKYVVPEYELDVTHVQRMTLGGWQNMLTRDGFCTSAVYRFPGVKDNYAHFEQGNGFLVVRREGSE